MGKQHVSLGHKYIVKVTGLGHSGEGVGKYEDFTIFIPGAIAGETVKVKINEVKKLRQRCN